MLTPVPAPPQSMPFHGTLRVAVEVAQAIGRAQDAALFVGDDGTFALGMSTGDVSVHASEICTGVAQSGCVTSGFVSGRRTRTPGEKLAFIAVPLLQEGRLVGVLYLEGLVEASARIDALVQRCARMIARMLGSAASLTATNLSTRGGTRWAPKRR